MKSTPNNTAVNSAMQTTESSNHEKIRARAYELYEQRGREGAHELEDWLQAEAEINSDGRDREQDEPRAA
jgi:Protein of unknown function (DUF2934)